MLRDVLDPLFILKLFSNARLHDASMEPLLDSSLLISISIGGVVLALTHHLPFWWLRFSRYDTVRAEWNLAGNTGWIAAAVAWGILLAQQHVIVMIVELLLLLLWGKWMLFGRPVSHPGPARAQPMERHAQWPSGKTHSFDGKWQFASGPESHQIDGQGLVGESAGRHLWYSSSNNTTQSYPEFSPATNPNTSDLLFRKQMTHSWTAEKPDTRSRPKTAAEAAKKGLQFYQMLQSDDGHWAGDYGGPHFLLPGLVAVWYITGRSDSFLSSEQRKAMSHYMKAHQQSDGGWGTHIESPSTMFGTCLNYVALRLLGMDAKSSEAIVAQDFIKGQGGMLYTASWAKFWMCCLGLMEWSGHNAVPPELWLLPSWLPFHPGRMWCHARMVYLPMSYLYGSRFRYAAADTDPLIKALREELYCESYASIDWHATRHWVAPMDNYSPKPWLMAKLEDVLASVWEGDTVRQCSPIKWIRSKGLEFAMAYISAEDIQTNFIDIGPVNKVMNMLSVFHAQGASSAEFQKHLGRVPDYLWVAEDGMKMQGYNGSQSWDTSFAMQAITEAGLADSFPEVTSGVWKYLERTQILSTSVSQNSPAMYYEGAEQRQLWYRHVSKGGWPFSSSAHGWPITDCTAEGLKAVLCIRDLPCVRQEISGGRLMDISPERLYDACNVLLEMQNLDTGGFATYENTRGYGWFELLNPSEVFGDIMIDYCYVECTSASLHGLSAFHAAFPDHRADEVKKAMTKGCAFLKSIQREDGSWYGSWACCFTYASWFAIGGLVVCGEDPKTSPAILKCAQFLLKHQNSNGGWGEDFTSCYDKQYAKNGMQRYGDQGSGVVPTAWALLSLMDAKCSDRAAVDRGVAYLMRRQQADGDWPQEGISGVFNRSCGITYTAYRNVFPIWALGRYSNSFVNQE